MPDCKLSVVERIASVRLGQCPRCAHKAFMAASATTAIATLCTFIAGASPVSATFWIAATCLALLWLSHLTVFALGASAIDKIMLERNPDQPVSPARRSAIGRFGAAFAFGVAATVALTPRGARAQTCTCIDPNPQCCWNYARDVHVCAPSDANCCGAKDSPWFCNQGHNCLGDGATQRGCS